MRLEGFCFLLALTSVVAYRPHQPPYHRFQGNGVLYNPETEKCCRGAAFPKTRSNYILCCGNSTYDITEQICCRGTPLPLSAGTRTACCGATTYDVKASLCCMGQVAKLPKDTPLEDLEHFECRGKKCVDTRDTAQNEVIPASSKKMAYGGYGGGGYSLPVPYPHPYPPFPRINNICNGTKFNTTTQMCCNRTIKESTQPNAACCGEDLQYDNKKEVCCKDPEGTWKLSPKPPTNPNNMYYYPGMESRCCGGVGYDSASQLCCNEKLHNIPEGRNRWEFQCCGSDVIDSSTHICCDGENKEEKQSDSVNCCGNQTYSYRAQLCCWYNSSTKVFDKPEKDVSSYRYQCCSGEMYNTKTHLCCYNYNQKQGHSETLLEKSTPNSQCCGNTTYNPTKEICCGSTLAALDEGAARQQCCGDEVYNPETHMCCDQKVQEVTDESKRSCCSIYASDDYMTGCFGMNRPHPGYYGPVDPVAYDDVAGSSGGEGGEETTLAPEENTEPAENTAPAENTPAAE